MELKGFLSVDCILLWSCWSFLACGETDKWPEPSIIYPPFFVGTALVVSAVESLMNNACDEVVLETETTNQAALKLYENLGFARHKRLLKYYLNGVDAFRLKLWIKYPTVIRERSRVSFVETVDVSRKGP